MSVYCVGINLSYLTQCLVVTHPFKGHHVSEGIKCEATSELGRAFTFRSDFLILIHTPFPVPAMRC